MKQKTQSNHRTRNAVGALILGISLAFAPMALIGTEVSGMLDDFSNEQLNSLGFPRLIMNDTVAGGKSTSKQTVADGVLTSTGDLAPPRGQPAWVSMVFLLTPDGSPADISDYQGIRMRIHIQQGMLSVSVNSTDVTNFDYHATMVVAGSDGYKEVTIPFSRLRRAWSEQTKLNTASVASVSLVAVGLQPSSFAFEIDEISFY